MTQVKADIVASAVQTGTDAGPIGQLLATATTCGASHVHIEPCEEGSAELWFRVAGARVRQAVLSPEEAFGVRASLCAAAGIELATVAPQRGWFYAAGDRIGVAMLGVAAGLRIVLTRGLRMGGDDRLRALGMPDTLAVEVQQALHGAGLVLVASPAGAGRTTTLRTLLDLVASPVRPALVIGLPEAAAACGGVHRAATGMVADLLRSGVDQDFDVLLVDSLEDRNAARAAVQAAAGGRLVLAGVAAANAVGALEQLRAWRVDAFRLASSLNIVLAQRLVRRLCAACREPVQAQGSLSALLGFDPGAIVYTPHGCSVCADSGFAGETGVFEAIRADADIRRLINDGGDEAILARHAFVSAPNLGSAARALARAGVTTPEEAVRISRG